MSTDKPLVYLILGASGSGRRELIVDLVNELEGARVAVMLAESETPDPGDAQLPNVGRWTALEEGIVAALPVDATHVFFITDGRRNPVDQLEAFKNWIQGQGVEIARVLTVVNCQLAEKHPPLLAWYEACVHFSDVVLLNRREGVENKWLSGFLAYFRDQFYPSLFELVKDRRVKNPALVLDPQARRLSHVFDAEQDWIFTDASGEEIDEQEEVEDEDGIEAKPEEDKYFERLNGGRRVKQLPDIRKFLAPVE